VGGSAAERENMMVVADEKNGPRASVSSMKIVSSDRPLALINLVSEQTMANVLPILALSPARVIHLCTRRMGSRSDWIIRAVRFANWKGEVRIEELSPMPEPSEVKQTVTAVLAESRADNLTPLVNFTGGTKLMSIGAFAAALAEKVPSMYVDTSERRFHDGHSTPDPLANFFPNGDMSFAGVRRKLRVDIIAAAHGCARVTGSRDWRRFVPLADHMMNHPDDEQRCWEAFYGRNGLFPEGREPRTKGAWKALAGKSLNLPDVVAACAVHCALLEGGRGRGRLPRKAGPEQIEECVRILTGGWWEIAVIRAAADSGRFRDLRWSVRVGSAGTTTDMEEDILGVDGVRLMYVSCKRGGRGARLTRLLDEVAAGSRRIGGSFGRTFLAVANLGKEGHAVNLYRCAREMNIEIITGDDIRDGHAFEHKEGV